ncbi:hypothetical protein CHLRE_01g050624v5 [Chlamydomonas reinhardtii]|uniref:Uncharacterized protein n=1 Tax=Chlamydomonas reinhardtii TaxID=3055 RepID=A0A2K3E805_CHLRE|nr:uncharacterized protein CHLRE_01g050624v5 [Chlamydomonas reinhardtii]PNW88919.1 hypothetical protein CHLRE_01g050624v5 [Chlamydomonas reinhardtii]
MQRAAITGATAGAGLVGDGRDAGLVHLASAWAQATSLAFVAAAEVMAMGTPVTSPSHPTAAMMTSTSK